MAQVFSRRFELLFKLGILGAAFLVTLLALVYRLNVRNDASAFAPVAQPVPFSHKHHVGDDGIDCRYCHASVESAAFAGMPALSTCMTCHSQLLNDTAVLKPLVQHFSDRRSLAWQRVHDLPDFVYFNHGIHVAKGVGCATCHGAIDRMPLTSRQASLDMQWCIACHRAPERYLRPRDRVFDLHWQAPDQLALGEQLKARYHIRDAWQLTACSTCHR